MQLLRHHLSFWWLILFTHFLVCSGLNCPHFLREQTRQEGCDLVKKTVPSVKNAEQCLMHHRPSFCDNHFHWWVVKMLPIVALVAPGWQLSLLRVITPTIKQGFMTGSWNITFHTSAYRWQAVLIRDGSSSMHYPLSAIPQCRVALSAMTRVPPGGKAKVLAHCCKLTIYCEGFPSPPVRAGSYCAVRCSFQHASRKVNWNEGWRNGLEMIKVKCL